jgi:hypothetical protein
MHGFLGLISVGSVEADLYELAGAYFGHACIPQVVQSITHREAGRVVHNRLEGNADAG